MGFTFKRLFLATVLLCSLLYLSLPNLAYAEDKATTEQTNISNPGSDADAPSGPNVDINTEVEKVEIETPASVTGERIQGTGTVTDFSTSGSKAFYTIRDSDSQVFHLIIDMDKTENNVYFLTDVKKANLENQIEPKENNTPPPAVEPMEPEKDGNGSFLILVLIGAVIAVVVIYFRVIKKKQGQSNADEDEMDEDYEDEDVFEDDKKDSKEIKDNKDE